MTCTKVPKQTRKTEAKAYQTTKCNDEESLKTTNSEALFIGSTVRLCNQFKPRLSIITNIIQKEDQHLYEVRPLNSDKKVIVPADKISLIRDEPADIPHSHHEVDKQLIREELSDEQVEQLWKQSASVDIPENERVTLYWHRRLGHASLVYLRRLAQRGILPSCIKNTLKMPLCLAYILAKAHRRS